jgi:hypothetical protein
MTKGTYTPSALHLVCRMLFDASCDASQNQPIVCNTAIHAGSMAPRGTPSVKLCKAPGNEQCWLFAWRDLSCLLPWKDISSV